MTHRQREEARRAYELVRDVLLAEMQRRGTETPAASRTDALAEMHAAMDALRNLGAVIGGGDFDGPAAHRTLLDTLRTKIPTNAEQRNAALDALRILAVRAGVVEEMAQPSLIGGTQ